MSRGSRPRVVVIAEGGIPTGFARVATGIFSRLHEAYEIVQLVPHPLPAEQRAHAAVLWPLEELPDQDGGEGDVKIAERVAHHRPDLVWILADVQIIRGYCNLLRDKLAAKLVGYCPIDITPLPGELVEPLHRLDALVSYTMFGRDALRDAFGRCATRSHVGPHHLHVIPHGVDARVFHPMERTAARAELLGDSFGDAFIVLNANRNQPRKRIDVTMAGFAEFARDKPANVHLHLHMGMKDRGWHIEELARRYGLTERTIYSTSSMNMPFVPDETMNLIYNSADVGLNTAIAEGWGLVAFEHALTGAAQVVPDHGVFAELWRGAAQLIPPVLTHVVPESGFEEHYVAAGDVARALDTLYRDTALRSRLSAAARSNASGARYSWDAIAAEWDRLFRALMSC